MSDRSHPTSAPSVAEAQHSLVKAVRHDQTPGHARREEGMWDAGELVIAWPKPLP